MNKRIPSEMFDAYAQEKKAAAKRRVEFAALFEKGAAGVKDGALDMDHIRCFFSNLVGEFNSGVVSGYDYPIWDTIGKVLSFDMRYSYAYVEIPENRQPDIKRDLCSEMGWLDEENSQREIHVAFKEYLVAAGALARRIGSSTYEGWRQLLVDREFRRSQGACFFGSEREFWAFHGKLKELTHLLWADNEIARHISVAQNGPHTSKTPPKNAGCEGG